MPDEYVVLTNVTVCCTSYRRCYENYSKICEALFRKNDVEFI